MSSYNCCIDQNPPSPDGLPSRPVRIPADPKLVASWTTASRLSKPEDAAELQALFRGDKSDVGDDESRVISVKKSASRLDAVKSKLRKHLSLESALSRHPPRSTVGNSDEEVQRRIELRLIRDRRIKEELSSEGAYDDDAKSLSTVATENSARKPWPSIHNEIADSLELFESVPHSSSMRKSADGLYLRKPRLIQRRHSLTALDHPKMHMRTATDWIMCTDSSDLPIPTTPILKPQRLPSIVDTATRRTSWRLSFASDQRATQLRALNHDYKLSSSTKGSGTRVTLPGPLKWFQGQVSSAPLFAAANILDNFKVRDGHPSQVACSTELDDYQGVDGNDELSNASIALQDMRISQRLTSRGLHSYSSSPQLSIWGDQSNFRARSNDSEVSHQKAIRKSQNHQSECNSGISESTSATGFNYHLIDDIPLNSAFVAPNTSADLERSRSSFPFWPVADKRQTSSSKDDSQKNTTAFEALLVISKTVDVVGSKQLFDSVSTSSVRQNRLDKMDDSTLASKSFTFADREAEIAMVEKQSTKVVHKSRQASSIRSKFNEELDEQQMPMPTVRRQKLSLSTLLRLPRLPKLLSRDYDGASPLELQVPGNLGFRYGFSNRSHSTGSTVSPGARSPGTMISRSPAREALRIQGDDTEGMWAQALKRTHEEYESQLISKPSPLKKDDVDHHGSFLGIRSASWKLKGKGKAHMGVSKNVETEQLQIEGRDFELLRELRQAREVETETANENEWADELEARERQAKAKSAAVGQKPTPRARMPPESWARFPSQTREERTGSAGLPDHVQSKDFAIQKLTNGVVEWMTSDRKHHHHIHNHHEKEQHHSLPTRVSRQIRTSLYKLRAATSTVRSDAIHGRKGSVSVGGKLEYPELEILAGEIAGEGLYEEVAREVEERMRKRERAARMAVFGEDGIDGGAHIEGNSSILEVGETSELSIADPRFYDDCVTLALEEDDENDEVVSDSNITVALGNLGSPNLSHNAIIMKNENDVSKMGENGGTGGTRNRVALRRSTLDFQKELEMMEGLERDRAIRSAKEAWGGSVG